MRRLALALIRAYQRYVSPYKGFRCAYRCHTGRAGCSALGYRAIRRHGVWGGLSLLRQRTYLCAVVHRRHRGESLVALRSGQRGFCDIGCIDLPCHGCDLPGLDGLAGACDLLSCCGDCGPCDLWPVRSRRKRSREQYVYIPPRARF